MGSADVAVVGAGVAGLSCALALEQQGFEVRVLEKGVEVGGRMRTEVIDGFRVDRGFQLLNLRPSGATAKIDVGSLNVQHVDPGVVLAHPDGYRILGWGYGDESAFFATLRSGFAEPQEIAAFMRWSAPVRRAGRGILRRDATLEESLDRFGIGGRLREEILAPMLTSLFGDSVARTSYFFAMRELRDHLSHPRGLPALGMQALPVQLALDLERRVEHHITVRDVRAEGTGVSLTTTVGEVRARAVVVAADPSAAASLLGWRQPYMRGLTTWWFAAPEAPTSLKVGFVDPHSPASGPLWHASVPSNVAPRYAPARSHLVQATGSVELSEHPGSEELVRAHLERIFRTSTATWSLITRHVVRHARPVPAPGDARARDVDLGQGVFVAGDHRADPTVDGALSSGRRAAAAVVDYLHGAHESPARLR